MSKSQLKKQAQAAAAAASRADAGMGMGMDDGSMPAMPVLPDPKVKFLWSGDPSVKQFDFSTFVQIWPAYLDGTKSYDEGRRVAKSFCCDAPNIGEMSEICQSLKLKHVVEPYKLYPRIFGYPGRIRVEIFKPDGTPIHPEIKNKVELIKYMGTKIPLLNSRISRLASMEEEARRVAEEQQRAATAAGAGGGAPGSAKKKKGKK